MRWRESHLIPSIATLVGIAAAAAYFMLAPAPRDTRQSMSRARGFEWHEWRTRAVQRMATRLQRDDPGEVVRGVFEAHRNDDWSRALSYGTEGRQRRFTPESMRARLTRFDVTRPVTTRVGEPILVGDRAAVPFTNEDQDGRSQAGHAVMLQASDGWRLEALYLNGRTEPPGDSEGVQRARLVYPGDQVFRETHDVSTPRVTTERLLLALRARRGDYIRVDAFEPLVSLLSDALLAKLPVDRFPPLIEIFHPEVFEADETRILRVRTKEDHAEALVALTTDAGSTLRRVECVRIPGATPDAFEWRVRGLRRMTGAPAP